MAFGNVPPYNSNGFRNFMPTVEHGPVYSKDYDSDGALWLPACGGAGSIFTFVGTFTSTRSAAGDYYLGLTAAANSPIVVVDISQVFEKIGADPILGQPGSFGVPPDTTNPPTLGGAIPPYVAPASGVGPIKVSDDFELHIIRGIMLTGYDVVYGLTTANLTTHTGTCYETSYTTSASGGTVVTKDAAQALGVATSSNLIIANIAIATPWVIGSNASLKGGPDYADYLEINITNPGTSVYHLYGIRLYFDYCLL